MKCLNRQARSNKAKLEAVRDAKKEQVRWDSLTPEEQTAEVAEKKKRLKRAREAMFALSTAIGFCDSSYDKFQ